MEIEVSKKLFSVDEYYQMAEVGILSPEDRVELVDGEILRMSPIGNRHLGCVNRANEVFVGALRGRVVVSIQNPLRLNNFTEFQPDIVLLKLRKDHYSAKHPMAEDALLVIEVSDTTFRYDHDVKLKRYAKAGIPEVWIVNPGQNELLVFRDPSNDRYQTGITYRPDDSITASSFPDTVFKAEDFLGSL
jgi:Uma2 family endonuclease